MGDLTHGYEEAEARGRAKEREEIAKLLEMKAALYERLAGEKPIPSLDSFGLRKAARSRLGRPGAPSRADLGPVIRHVHLLRLC